MILTNLKFLNFPIFIIQLFIFILVIDFSKFRLILNNFLISFLRITRTLETFMIKVFYILALIGVFLLICSFGPINQSDTVNYYVGYPYQFFQKNSHYIDGDLGKVLSDLAISQIFHLYRKNQFG